RAGDDWLSTNLGAYATWAQSNNSLLILTFDEDESGARPNKIPTIFYGANLNNGTTPDQTYTLHNMLRTIEDMYGTTHAGSASSVRTIGSGVFADDRKSVKRKFQEGSNGYTGTQDTDIRQADGTDRGSATQILV